MNGDLENKLDPSEVVGLIAACREGDCSAYASLTRLYSGRIFAICYANLINTQDAEDMAQQTFIKGFANIRQIRRNENFGVWIGRIAKNMCVDFLRRQKRRRNLNVSDIGADLLSSQEHSGLGKTLAELSEENRSALMIYYFEGHSAGAVAETFEISEEEALALLSRARKQLRKLLQAKGDA